MIAATVNNTSPDSTTSSSATNNSTKSATDDDTGATSAKSSNTIIWDTAIAAELAFVNIVFLKHKKCPHAWSHRRWLLSKSSCWTPDTLKSEYDVCTKLARAYDRNYYAWSHRTWITLDAVGSAYANQALRKCEDILDAELQEMILYSQINIADSCALHHHVTLLLLRTLVAIVSFNTQPMGPVLSLQSEFAAVKSALSAGTLPLQYHHTHTDVPCAICGLWVNAIARATARCRQYPEYEPLHQHASTLAGIGTCFQVLGGCPRELLDAVQDACQAGLSYRSNKS